MMSEIFLFLTLNPELTKMSHDGGKENHVVAEVKSN